MRQAAGARSDVDGHLRELRVARRCTAATVGRRVQRLAAGMAQWAACATSPVVADVPDGFTTLSPLCLSACEHG